jgi:hypothetical protein
MIWCIREVIPQDIWCLHTVTINLQVKIILWAHENEANDTVDLWLLRQQILAMQKAYDNVVSPAIIVKTILDKFKDFNPFNLLKNSFWHCSLFSCFFQSDAAWCEATHWIRGQASLGALKKFKKGEMWRLST